ncbi:adenosylmethionine decarboxylase [Saccharothrix xinjiangensis]|uniref:S-adenosylmethionine decarboxylase proenzyme n=1 Tax=Saccharothrix xinjiangensis TaxID=204798 RepID=A0ABV9YC38_9PSEU
MRDGTGVHHFAGRHVFAELTGVVAGRLDDEAFLRRTLAEALSLAGATVCGLDSHRFEPQGVTVLALLAESHASLHTYPEFGAAFVDVFTCGSRADPESAVRLLAGALDASIERLRAVRRGLRTAPALADPLT